MINQTNTPSRARLFGGSATVAVAAMLIAGPAFAQAAPRTAAAAAADDESTIVVTGSLISNPNLTRAAPVNVTTSEEINLRQTNVAEDLLRDIPGVVPNVGSAVNNGNGGASYVDLRGLGSFRNIVLLDGARIAPSGLVGRVDLNNIPLSLVDRVEVLTGGASTTYGADAISGVVNFVTKQNFTGVELSLGDALTEKGDGRYFRSDLTVGGNFDDGKGNAVLSVGYQQSDPVFQGDRDFGAFQFSSFTGGVSGSGTSVPSRFSGTRPLTGGVPNTVAPFVQIENGNLVANPGGLANGGVRQINTAGQAVGTFHLFNFNPYNVYQTPFSRFNIFGAAKYEVNDHLEVYTRALFSKNTVSTIIAPSGSFGSAVIIPLSNPYLPAALRNQFCAFNVAPNVIGANNVAGQIAYTPRFTPTECNAAAAATSPTDPNYRTVKATLNRRLIEGAPRQSDYTTTIFDYKIGVRGDITSNLKYDLYGAYGESENRQSITGYVLTSRLRNAVLATNKTTCLPDASGVAPSGCVPIDIFGQQGAITPAMIGYVSAPSSTDVKTSLAQVHGTISGDFGATLPSASDPISFAVGGEYRKYTASQEADVAASTPGELGGAGAATVPFHGGYNVVEAFGELIAPLVQDKPLFHSLTIGGGIRYSSYKVNAAGDPSYNTTTYKGEGTWEPVQGIKLRGGYSHAVRAPNINELFAPLVTGLTSISLDPCAGAGPSANANLRAVCIAQGAPAGTIGSINNPTAGQGNVTTGGNVNVKPEKSDSYTLGGVLQPSFLPGFSLSADYYHIKVKDAITTATPGDLVAACFGAPPYNVSAAAASSPACTGIRRNPITGALDGDNATTGGLFAPQTNLGQLLTDGIDLIVNYRRDIGFAKLGLSFNGNYTFRSKFKANQNDPNSLDRECTGFYSSNCASIQPKFQWSQRTTLGFDRFDVSLLWRHIDKARQEPDDVINGNGPAYVGPVNDGQTDFGIRDFGHIKAYDYFDLSGRIDIMKNLELTLTVQNLFDRKPPLVGLPIGTSSYDSGNTYPSTYDALGRRYAIGAKVRF